MKLLNLTSMVAGVTLFGLVSCNSQEKQNTEISMDNEINKISYSLGVNIATNLKQQGLDSINAAAFTSALNDVYGKGETPKFTPEEAGEILNDYFQKLQAAKAEEGVTKGKDFLAENAKKEGVTVLPSGLQYIVMTEGTGEKPGLTDKVTTHYHGTKIDGTVFDSSVDRGQPTSFPVNGVIAGWTEALQLMATGSKWKLFIPSDLAYGPRGAGQSIGPDETLIFEVELISIDK